MGTADCDYLFLLVVYDSLDMFIIVELFFSKVRV